MLFNVFDVTLLRLTIWN